MTNAGDMNDHLEFILSYNTDQTVVSVTISSEGRISQDDFLTALTYFVERTESERQNLFAEEPQEH